MLKSLFIQNYALIRQLEIGFHPGLSIISGETGAGKSILLGAISLILGQRADTGVLLDKSRKCIVEAGFTIRDEPLKQLFDENDIDFDPDTMIRREISQSGKSRAFVNDTPVNLSVLRDIGLRLLDIHSQHQNLLLADTHFQLNVVDDFARHSGVLEKYRKTYETFKRLESTYNNLLDMAGKSKADLDYYQFQYDQLEKARLQPEEQETLEVELETLNHAEEIKTSLTNAAWILSEDENALLPRLREATSLIRKIVPYLPGAGELEQRLESSYIELKDIASEIEGMGTGIEYNPERIGVIGERLDLIYSLQQKHRVNTIAELLHIKEELRTRLDEIANYDRQIEETAGHLSLAEEKLHELAATLTKQREKVIPEIEKTVIGLLHQLGIPHGKFAVQRRGTDHFTPYGSDHIEFLFSANKQGRLQDIASVASGGEISRLMLSLKSLVTRTAALPTVIFDEIDAGVSGDTADKVGNILNEMAAHMQVINITHLPQIASKGEYHYLVYKEDRKEATHTYIKLLNREERIMEIAKLLSGEELTDAAVVNARALLKY